MRNILNGTASRGALFMADLGPSNGGGPAGFWPFNRGNRQSQQTNNNQQRVDNTNNQKQSDNNTNNSVDNNTEKEDESKGDFETFLNDNKDLWQDKESDGNENTDPDEEERRRKHLETQNSRLREYISKINFGVKIDMTKLSESIQNNNPEYLQTVFNEALQRGFARSFDDVTRMITAAESRIKEFANNIAQTNVSARESELSLFETVPLARNPMFKPIAMSMKARFLKKGKSDEEANKLVQKAFTGIRKADPSMLGIEEEDDEDLTMPNNGRRVTNRNSGRRGNSNDELDFVELLTGQK